MRESDSLSHCGANQDWLAIIEIRPEKDIGIFVVTNLGRPDETAPAANELIATLFNLYVE